MRSEYFSAALAAAALALAPGAQAQSLIFISGGAGTEVQRDSRVLPLPAGQTTVLGIIITTHDDPVTLALGGHAMIDLAANSELIVEELPSAGLARTSLRLMDGRLRVVRRDDTPGE